MPEPVCESRQVEDINIMLVDWPLIEIHCKKSVRGKPSSNDISEAKVVKLSET